MQLRSSLAHRDVERVAPSRVSHPVNSISGESRFFQSNTACTHLGFSPRSFSVRGQHDQAPHLDELPGRSGPVRGRCSDASCAPIACISCPSVAASSWEEPGGMRAQMSAVCCSQPLVAGVSSSIALVTPVLCPCINLKLYHVVLTSLSDRGASLHGMSAASSFFWVAPKHFKLAPVPAWTARTIEARNGTTITPVTCRKSFSHPHSPPAVPTACGREHESLLTLQPRRRARLSPQQLQFPSGYIFKKSLFHLKVASCAHVEKLARCAPHTELGNSSAAQHRPLSSIASQMTNTLHTSK